MTLSSFDDLLQAARVQPEPQRLLFVFTAAGVPDDATPAQRSGFRAGEGGTLTPLMCVDKTPAELVSFNALCDEARQAGPAWDIVFVAAMSGRGGAEPTSEQAAAPLQQMVDGIKAGRIDGYVPFDADGVPLRFV